MLPTVNKRFKLSAIRDAAKIRPSGYFDEVMSKARVIDEHTIELSAEDREYIAQKYRNKPAGDWPIWALIVSMWRGDSDRGIGDTIRRELGSTKREKFKRWAESVFGIWSPPCACGKAREWNVIYPYN
jgi:hypothetical protein